MMFSQLYSDMDDLLATQHSVGFCETLVIINYLLDLQKTVSAPHQGLAYQTLLDLAPFFSFLFFSVLL